MTQRVDLHLHAAAAKAARAFPLSEPDTASTLRIITDSWAEPQKVPLRRSPRFQLDGKPAVVSVVHPGGSIAACDCVMVDLSAGGALFLYPGFLHGQTRCVLHIQDLRKQTLMLQGEVVQCRFATRSIHAVGLAWDEPVDPREFVSAKKWQQEMARGGGPAPETLAGRVLTVAMHDIEREMFRVFLGATSLRTHSAAHAGEALDTLSYRAFDAIVIDTENLDEDPADFIARVRAEGCADPVVIVADPRAPAIDADHLGVSMRLDKPLLKEVTVAALRDIIGNQHDPLAGAAPIRSELDADDDRARAIHAYIKHAREAGKLLGAALKADHYEETARLARSVRNTAGGFGFPLLGHAAELTLTALNASGSALEAGPDVRRLIRLIDRLEEPQTQPRAA